MSSPSNPGDKKKSVASEALKRRVSVYPTPKYHSLVTAYASANEMKKSEAVNHMIKEFFSRMPEGDKARIAHYGRNHY